MTSQARTSNQSATGRIVALVSIVLVCLTLVLAVWVPWAAAAPPTMAMPMPPAALATLSPRTATQPVPVGTAAKAYIGLFKANAVAVLDTGSNRVLRTIPIPAGPHGLVITPDGRTVYVSSDGASTVSVIDTATDQVTRTIEVGKMPHGLAITPDGRQVLVAVFGTSQVAFIDTASNRVVAHVPVPSPHNFAISPDGQTAYVAAQKPGATALVILDVPKKVQVGIVPLDKTPRALTFSPDGKALYFTQAGINAVQVLNPATHKLVGQIAVGASPHQPLFTPDGKNALVVVQGPGELAILNPATRTSRTTVTVGQLPHWVALTPNGHTAYVTNEKDNNLAVVDLATHKVTATIALGQAPRKIVIQPVPTPLKPVTPPVVITNFVFTPATLTVAPGQPIVWINHDSVSHTITSDDGKWDSGELAPGQQFTLTLPQPGTYAYHCSIHPFMQGTVIVKG